MKRDINLIRNLMLQMEGADVDLSIYSDPEITYHEAMLIEAGLCHGAMVPDEQGLPSKTKLRYLTWEGHEFLADSRDKAIWSKALETTKKLGGSIAFPVLKTLLTEMVKEQIGLK